MPAHFPVQVHADLGSSCNKEIVTDGHAFASGNLWSLTICLRLVGSLAQVAPAMSGLLR